MKKVDFVIDGKIYNYDWFTMRDFMGLYSKKHNWEKIYDNSGEKEARKYLYGFVDDMFDDVPEKYRMMIFISLILASEGRSSVILTNNCSKCHDEHHISLSLNPVVSSKTYSFVDVDGNKIEILFGNLNYRNRENIINELLENITIVKINGQELEWNVLAESTKMAMLSYVDSDVVKDLINVLSPCSVKFHDAYGCEDIQSMNGRVEYDDMKIFDWLINKSEVNTIYQMSTIMASNGFNMTDYMNMAPFERREILKNIKANNEVAGKEQ